MVRNTGRHTVEVLQASAAANQSRDSAYVDQRRSRACWMKASRASAMKKNDQVFFCSAAHATVWTLIGCTAKSAATHQAPGSRHSRATRQTSTAFTLCMNKLTR